FVMSRLDWNEPHQEPHALWLARYRRLLQIRASKIAPRLSGMAPYAGSYRVLGPKAVSVGWRLGDGARLMLLANFTGQRIDVPEDFRDGGLVYSSAQPGAPLSATFFLAAPYPNA